MSQNLNRKLVLETGEEFLGTGYGASCRAVGEIVFNTSMVGYQEILSDSAYDDQIVVMTYPPMGQYGITDEDFESRVASPAGMVVRECCDTPSNFRFTKTLAAELEDHGTPLISGLDTRMITRIIRDKGCMRAAIVEAGMTKEEALKLIADTPVDKRPVSKTSCHKTWYKRTPHHKFDVVVVDCGVKLSIIDSLLSRGCNVTVVPFDTTAEEILAFNPDGVMISSGPGDPRELPEMIETINGLKGKLPVCGISLGHQLICMSYGAKAVRLKAGHHGGRPVKDLETGKIEPVEHNHNFTIDRKSLEGTGLNVVYEDVVDRSVEGVKCTDDKVLSSQFYPEGAPGPQESSFFERFIKWMEE